MGKLNKDCSTPLYQQLTDLIKEKILDGRLQEGDRIMTETEISQEYDVSRITVRKAIENLVEEGILIKKQGIGTFVAGKRLTRNMGIFTGFSQNCEAEGKKAGTKLLSASLAEPTGRDEKVLKLGEGEKVIVLRRLRLIDEKAAIIEENHFSQKYAFLLGLDLERSLYTMLRENGIFPYGGKRVVTVCYATKEEGELLGVEEGAAMMLMKDICVDESGEIIHTCKSLIVPDRYELVINTAPQFL